MKKSTKADEENYSDKFLDLFDEYFPKGKSKLRGEALVIQALAFYEGQRILKSKIIELINNWDVEPCCHGIPAEALIREIKKL